MAEWENVDYYPNRWATEYAQWATTPSASSTTQARASSSVWRAWVEVRTSDYKLRLDEAQAEIGDALRSLCQACPSCHILIAKAVACDHIRCPCGADFCYSCGGYLNSGGDEEQAGAGGEQQRGCDCSKRHADGTFVAMEKDHMDSGYDSWGDDDDREDYYNHYYRRYEHWDRYDGDPFFSNNALPLVCVAVAADPVAGWEFAKEDLGGGRGKCHQRYNRGLRGRTHKHESSKKAAKRGWNRKRGARVESRSKRQGKLSWAGKRSTGVALVC